MTRRLLCLLTALAAMFALTAGDALATPELSLITDSVVYEPPTAQIGNVRGEVAYTRAAASDPVSYTANIRTMGGSATEFDDYSPWIYVPITLTAPTVGVPVTEKFNITVFGDDVFEGDETFDVLLAPNGSMPFANGLGQSSARTVTILDVEDAPPVTPPVTTPPSPPPCQSGSGIPGPGTCPGNSGHGGGGHGPH